MGLVHAYSKPTLYEGGCTVRWDSRASSALVRRGRDPASPTSTATTCGRARRHACRARRAHRGYNDASNPANFHPRLPRYGRLTHDQDRTGVTASYQWRPSTRTLLTAEMLYSKLDATRQEDFLEAISFSRTAAQGG